MSFLDSLNRILETTSLDSRPKLAIFLGISPVQISKKIKTDDFPLKWAYKISCEYNLLFEWIMTGKGPRKLSDVGKKSQRKFVILDEIEEWLHEIQEQNPEIDRDGWFAAEMIDNFKSYRERKLRKDIEKEEEYSATSYKVA